MSEKNNELPEKKIIRINENGETEYMCHMCKEYDIDITEDMLCMGCFHFVNECLKTNAITNDTRRCAP